SFVTKKNVPQSEYIFARQNSKGDWKKSDGKSYKVDRIFMTTKWYDKQYNVIMDKNILKGKVINDAPEIIKGFEKFVDSKGNIINIEARGKRNVKECYFKVKDIVNGFGMSRLQSVITDSKGGYRENQDYIYFNVSTRKGKKKQMFLTYGGL